MHNNKTVYLFINIIIIKDNKENDRKRKEIENIWQPIQHGILAYNCKQKSNRSK